MTTITNLTAEEVVTRTAAYMKRNKASLIETATLLGVETTGSKAAIVARIISKSAKIETEVKPFDFSGLFLR